MSGQPRCTLPSVAIALSLVSSLVSMRVFGETPRTPWGDPDLQGMWVNNSATPLERPNAFQGKETLTDEELQELKKKAAEVLDGGDAFFADDFVTAAVEEGVDFRSFDQKTGNYNQFWIVDREFDNRTSLIVDPPGGKVPALTPEGRKRLEKATRGFLGIDPAGPEDLSDQVRCITYGVPNILAGYNSFFQILQTPESVVIFQELIHDARIVPMDGRPHLPENVRQWHGDPRGRWDGDTLIVESTNFSPKSNYQGSAENLHLVERFTRVDAETIVYQITADDPETFARAWTIQIPLKSSPDPIFEYACHEGNLAMEGILKGARAEERKQQK
jgi:hypothetical protein